MLGVAMVTSVAFTISYALSVTNLLSGIVTSFTETARETNGQRRENGTIHQWSVNRKTGRHQIGIYH